METQLAILYEHPEWFERLFAELTRRGIEFEKWSAHRLLFDPEELELPKVVVNRMSPSSWRRGHANGLFATLDFVASLENRGVRVVNGSFPYRIELSKTRQLDLLRDCGLGYPRARIVNHRSLILEAARGLEYPVCIKPNIGGSGAGIRRFDTPAELEVALPSIDLGVDYTALVQEFLPARGGCITRVEVLNGNFLYAIRIWPDFQSFNLCPADACAVCPTGDKFRVEKFDPPKEAIEGALKLARAARLDIGGIEYLVDDRTGRICYYDINALSNFVADARNVVGFDPTARFVDYLESLTGARSLK
jgi:glutathione synthase/RimK-type ligase-like ATP-grasp enzyme